MRAVEKYKGSGVFFVMYINVQDQEFEFLLVLLTISGDRTASVSEPY